LRLALLDLLERLLTVRRAREDADPRLGEVLRHGFEHRRVIVGDDAGDGLRLAHRGRHPKIPETGENRRTCGGMVSVDIRPDSAALRPQVLSTAPWKKTPPPMPGSTGNSSPRCSAP